MNLNTPSIYEAGRLESEWNGPAKVRRRLSDGRWVPARSMGYPGLCLFHRLRCAWLVFTGRADVLLWEGQP